MTTLLRRCLACTLATLLLWPSLAAASGSVDAAHRIVNTGGSPDNLKQWSDKDNAHWHEYEGETFTNRTGGSLVAGDVAALDSANDSSVVLSDVVSSAKKFVVAQASISNTAAGEFARSGVVSIKATGAIARGEYVRKSATTKTVETTGVTALDAVPPPRGALGIALAAAAGGFVTGLLYGQTVIGPVLDVIGPQSPIANTVAETTLYSVSIPVSALGTLGEVLARVRGHISGTGTTGDCTWRMKYGATTMVTVVQQISSAAGDDLATSPFNIAFALLGAGATNAQRAHVQQFLSDVTGGTTVQLTPVQKRGTAAEDSTAVKVLAITVQFSAAAAGNTVTLEHGMTTIER